MGVNIVPFYRLEADGTETCFVVETKLPLDDGQVLVLRRKIMSYFQYLPTHVVTEMPSLVGKDIGMIGPRLSIETSTSSGAVEILRHVSDSMIRRVEVFRRYRIPRGVDMATFLDARRDRVQECIYDAIPRNLQAGGIVPPVVTIPFLREGIRSVEDFCAAEGLQFGDWHMNKIAEIYSKLQKNPTDSAILQLAQVWSDHCWHIIFFMTRFVIDGVERPYTLIDALKEPYNARLLVKGDNTRIGPGDNASAIVGYTVPTLLPVNPGHPSIYDMFPVTLHIHISAETHNFPEHEEPYQGSATEILGELRDGLGTGKCSLVQFTGCGRVVGSLRFPNGYRIPGEFIAGLPYTYRKDKATPMEIVLKGLQGWQDAANAVGKPCTHGFFFSGAVWRPRRNNKGEIVLERMESMKQVGFGSAGGVVREDQAEKDQPQVGMKIVRIGGPAYPIGYGGGSGSSTLTGDNKTGFDVNAVQRGNAEMKRRVISVYEACFALGLKTPFASNHDQGAGGIANLLTELIGRQGGRIYLASVNRGDPTMSDKMVWVCEYQEGMGVLVLESDLPMLKTICQRENCPLEEVGEITGDGKLLVFSQRDNAEVLAENSEPIIELDLVDILDKGHTFTRSDTTPEIIRLQVNIPRSMTFEKAVRNVFRRSEVGSKEWITRLVDGSVSGLVVLNQYCGPFSTPINDCSMVALGYESDQGAAASFGVHPYLTTLDPAAGTRWSLGEAYTNLMNVAIDEFELIKFICNWMWPANLKEPDGELARLDMAVCAARDALLELASAIFGGKDSSSMATWVEGLLIKSLETVVFTSIAPIRDVNCHVTPDIKYPGESVLIHLDIAQGKRRLGGSSFGQSLEQLGDWGPDMDDSAVLKRSFVAAQYLLKNRLYSAGHDIGSGGLITTVAEMCFASGCGVTLDTSGKTDVYAEYLAEELGYVMECPDQNLKQILQKLNDDDVPHRVIGQTMAQPVIKVFHNGQSELDCSMDDLRRDWEMTGYELRKLRVDSDCAKKEWRNTRNRRKPVYRIGFTPKPTAPEILIRKPFKAAVIREQGSNGHPELISACRRVGFETMDITMSDFLSGEITSLDDFRFITFAAGFSYKDILGAAVGWSKKIMDNPQLFDIFEQYRAAQRGPSLGICNGAQLGLRNGWVLPDLPPEKWPQFTEIPLGKFNHQWVRLKIVKSPSIMLEGMEGSILGTWVANGEGRFNCDHAPEVFERVIKENLAPLVYVDPLGRRTTALPYSPSGSFVAGVCDPTGLHLFMMPHAFDRSSQTRLWPYVSEELKGLEENPWLNMGQNAMKWCLNN